MNSGLCLKDCQEDTEKQDYHFPPSLPTGLEATKKMA